MFGTRLPDKSIQHLLVLNAARSSRIVRENPIASTDILDILDAIESENLRTSLKSLGHLTLPKYQKNHS
jgi:hypothetical protein